MGAHKTNPTAALATTLPPLVPPGYRVGVDIQPRVVPKANVLMVPRERIRITDGMGQVLVGEPPEWRTPPEGTMIHELGEPLPPELCDVALMVATVVEDTAGARMLVVPGQPPRGKASLLLFAELARVPLVEWQAGHLGALRGEGEE